LSKKEDAERKAEGFAMHATGRLVLESSIEHAWCFADEKNAYAHAIAALYPAVEATVPGLWPLGIVKHLKNWPTQPNFIVEISIARILMAFGPWCLLRGIHSTVRHK
jgi:hypothetical protein